MSKMDPSSKKTVEPIEDEEDDNETSSSNVIDKSYIDNITYWWKKFNAIVVVTPYDKMELPHKATAGEFNSKNEDMIIAAANIVADELGYPVKQLTEKLKTVMHIYMPAEACVRNKIMFATITAILSDAAKQHSGRSDDLQTIQTAPLVGLSDDEYAQMLQQDQPIPRDEWLPPIKNILQKCKTQSVSSGGVRKEPIIEGGMPVFSVSGVPAPTTPSKTDGKIVVEDLGCGCQIPDEILKAIVPQSDNEELVKSIPNVEDLSMYVADSIEDISEKSQSCGIGESVYFVPCASKKIVSEIIPVVAKNKADAIAKIKMLKSDDSCETVGKCYSSADIVKRKEISDVWSTSDEDDNLMSLLSKLNK
jgi:hypothetical protein